MGTHPNCPGNCGEHMVLLDFLDRGSAVCGFAGVRLTPRPLPPATTAVALSSRGLAAGSAITLSGWLPAGIDKVGQTANVYADDVVPEQLELWATVAPSALTFVASGVLLLTLLSPGSRAGRLPAIGAPLYSLLLPRNWWLWSVFSQGALRRCDTSMCVERTPQAVHACKAFVAGAWVCQIPIAFAEIGRLSLYRDRLPSGPCHLPCCIIVRLTCLPKVFVMAK